MKRGFIRAEGTKLVDEAGRTFQIRGVNLGNWFVPECYMAAAGVGDFETGVYTFEGKCFSVYRLDAEDV